MNSINDERGCSVCQPGKENYTTYNTRLRGKRVRMYQYDYRTESGELFACCAPTLEESWQARKPTNTVKSDQLTLRSISLTYVAVKNIRLMQNCLKKVR